MRNCQEKIYFLTSEILRKWVYFLTPGILEVGKVKRNNSWPGLRNPEAGISLRQDRHEFIYLYEIFIGGCTWHRCSLKTEQRVFSLNKFKGAFVSSVTMTIALVGASLPSFGV